MITCPKCNCKKNEIDFVCHDGHRMICKECHENELNNNNTYISIINISRINDRNNTRTFLNNNINYQNIYNPITNNHTNYDSNNHTNYDSNNHTNYDSNNQLPSN